MNPNRNDLRRYMVFTDMSKEDDLDILSPETCKINSEDNLQFVLPSEDETNNEPNAIEKPDENVSHANIVNIKYQTPEYQQTQVVGDEYDNKQYVDEELFVDEDYESDLYVEEQEEEGSIQESAECVEEEECVDEWDKNILKYYGEFAKFHRQELFEGESDDQDEDESIKNFPNLTASSASGASCLFKTETELNLTASNHQMLAISMTDPLYDSETIALDSLVPSEDTLDSASTSDCTKMNMSQESFYERKDKPKASASTKSEDYPLDMQSTSSCIKLNKPPESYYKRSNKPKASFKADLLNTSTTSSESSDSCLKQEDEPSKAADILDYTWFTDYLFSGSSEHISTTYQEAFESSKAAQNERNPVAEWNEKTYENYQYSEYITIDDDTDKNDNDEWNFDDNVSTTSNQSLSDTEPNLNIPSLDLTTFANYNYSSSNESPSKINHSLSSVELGTNIEESKLQNKPKVRVPIKAKTEREKQVKQGAIKKDTYCCPLRLRSQPKDDNDKLPPKPRRCLKKRL